MRHAYDKWKMQGKEELAKELIEIGKEVYKNSSKAMAYDAMMFKCRSYYVEQTAKKSL